METRRLTKYRLLLAITSSAAEETFIWTLWRFVLPEFGIELPLYALIIAMVVWFCFSVWLFVFVTRTLRRQATVGLPSMVGTRGRAASRLNPEGMVRIRGELWGATTPDGNIEPGTEILVVGEEGLKLFVRRWEESDFKR